MYHFLIRVYKKVVVPVQVSNCSNCGLQIIERRRRPCARCGGMNRDISRSVREFIGWKDLAG